MLSPARQAAAASLQTPALALPRRLALGGLALPRARQVVAQATPSATQTVIQRDFAAATSSAPSTSGRPSVATPEPLLVRRRRCRPPPRQFAAAAPST
jgi:hypothetical protein